MRNTSESGGELERRPQVTPPRYDELGGGWVGGRGV